MDYMLFIRTLASMVAMIFFLMDIIESRKATAYTPYVFVAFLLSELAAIIVRADMLCSFIMLSPIQKNFLITGSEIAICFSAIRFWLILRAE